MANYIGILIDHRRLGRMKRGAYGHERLKFYHRAAVPLGMLPVYFSLNRVDFLSGTVRGYRYADGRVRPLTARIPAVVHNRAMPANKAQRARLKRLKAKAYVFNGQNRYSKYRVHRLLSGRFPANLPDTALFSEGALKRMMDQYGDVFVKPRSGSVGIGIANAKRRPDGSWRVRMPSGRKALALSGPKARAALARLARGKSYLVQSGIPLARWRGRPFDIRVSVQRDGTGEWQVTGMVGKVARKGSHVTNVARGGTVERCSVLLRQFPDAGAVSEAVRQTSLRIVQELGRRLPQLADVGLDMGVDRDGKPYFIEMNCRDQRYSFHKAGLSKAFFRTYENPMKYGKYVMDRLAVKGRRKKKKK